MDYSELAAQVFDNYLQQLGEDTAAYVRTVCQTIVLTVPKAIIHCQVRHLLTYYCDGVKGFYLPCLTCCI